MHDLVVSLNPNVLLELELIIFVANSSIVYSLVALTEDFLLLVLRILLSDTLLKKAVIFTIDWLQIAWLSGQEKKYLQKNYALNRNISFRECS